MLTYHDDRQLLGQLNQTAAIPALLVPQSSKDVFVMAWVAHKLPLEEGDVDDGGIEIDELEDEDFECEVVIKVRLSSVHF